MGQISSDLRVGRLAQTSGNGPAGVRVVSQPENLSRSG